jgi:pyroglutamyl-peptidase
MVAPPRTLLLTAFEPFGGFAVNPSWEAVRPLDGVLLRGRVLLRAVRLPVSFAKAPGELRRAIDAHRPDAIVSFGVATERRAVSLERHARNISGGRAADNDGVRVEGPIDPAGPAEVRTALPLDRIRRALNRADIPVENSDDAGGYLCNRIFWEERAAFAGPSGFVHVPPFDAIPEPRLRAAVRAVAEAVAFEEVRAAACTTTPRPLDAAANLDVLEGLARRAAAAGARLVLFPELATSGLALTRGTARRAAEPADGPGARRLAALSRELGVFVAFGFPESCGERLFNSALLLGPAGERFLYRKRRLFGHDFAWATPGEAPGVFETAVGRVQIAICHDVVYEDIAAESEGCDAVLMPTNWIGGEGPEGCLAAFRAPVLAADRAGEEDGVRFEGRSGLYEGGRRRQAGGMKDDFATAEFQRVAI